MNDKLKERSALIEKAAGSHVMEFLIENAKSYELTETEFEVMIMAIICKLTRFHIRSEIRDGHTIEKIIADTFRMIMSSTGLGVVVENVTTSLTDATKH